MDTRSKYQRIFLIFNSEDIGYGVGQEPSGFVKIEVNEGKGKLLASVQNLNENRGFSYKLYIMKCSNDSFVQVCAGTIPIIRNRGELKIEIDPLNVCGSNVPVDEFNVAAVIGEDSISSGTLVNCPLVAYKNGKLAWRDKLRTALSKVMKEKPATNTSFIGLEKKEVTSENPIEDIAEKLEIGNTKSEFGLTTEIEPIQENETVTSEVLENTSTDNRNGMEVIQRNNETEDKEVNDKEIIDKENKETTLPETNIKQDDFDEYKQMLKELASKEKESMLNENRAGCTLANQGFCKPYQNIGEVSPCQNCKMNKVDRNKPAQETKQSGNMEKLRVSLDKFFESYDPFRSRRRDYRWWKVGSPVQLNNVLYQCDVKTPLLFNPALMMAHFKYRHIIVGIYSDSSRRREYIVCGIPGVYNVDEKPFGNMCRWVQVEGSRPRYGAFGYWLVYIDGKTGKFLSVN